MPPPYYGFLRGWCKIQRMSNANLFAIFEDPALDFTQNRAEGDDLLGDAYEYLMRHFATESGKSKGQGGGVVVKF